MTTLTTQNIFEVSDFKTAIDQVYDLQVENKINTRKLTVNQRKEYLRNLESVILRHRSEIEEALFADLQKSKVEADSTEIFPVLSESTQNYDSALRLHNIHLKKISGFMGLPKPLTSYVARHSWATLAKKKGISTQIISESMGHNSEKTTRIYLSSLDRSVIDDANAKLISGI